MSVVTEVVIRAVFRVAFLVIGVAGLLLLLAQWPPLKG